MDEQQAIRRLKRGDLGGLELLMQQYQVRATRAAFLITHDEAIAQDVVQETFIRICERIRQYDEARPFEPYLFGSVVHAALNAMRGSENVRSLEAGSDEVENLLDQADEVETQLEAAQLQQTIQTALVKLSPRQRAVIVQRYYLEMSEQEMAQALQAAPGTVKWLLNAARERLRHLLWQKDGSNE
jgi:RNA polymerase sigma-70 factor (ECF subfamily)